MEIHEPCISYKRFNNSDSGHGSVASNDKMIVNNECYNACVRRPVNIPDLKERIRKLYFSHRLRLAATKDSAQRWRWRSPAKTNFQTMITIDFPLNYEHIYITLNKFHLSVH
jgi:hypothetical protein